MVNKPANSRVAVAMIVKGDENPETLERCLSSLAKWVDGIFITITTEDKGVSAVGNKYGAVVDIEPDKFWRTADKEAMDWLKGSFKYDPILKEGDKMFQFDEARNHNFAQVGPEFDWILWIDTDDVLRGGKNLKKVVAEAESRKAESVYFNYIYQAVIVEGKIQSILIQHLRERLVRNIPGIYKWVAPIHETLIEQRPTNKIETKDCEILHISSDKRMRKAIDRNIKTLEYNIFEKSGHDPRTIYYLGKAYFDKKEQKFFERALGLFKVYLHGSPEYDGTNRSGWTEERAQCYELAAEIYRATGYPDNALKAGFDAIKESAKFPSGYLSIALTYIVLQDFHAALHWVNMATNVPPPVSTLVNNPRDLQARALEVTYVSCINLSMLDQATSAAEQLLRLFPGSQEMTDRVLQARKFTTEREVTKSIRLLAKYLEKTGETAKLDPLLRAVPAIAAKNPIIAELQRRVHPPRTWEDDEVAIFCGPGFTNWSPKSLSEPGGSFVGGSEEAVIYMANELRDLGWNVTVYADPGEDEGDIDGVNYQNYFRFNGLDEFNIVVAWRNPGFVDSNYKAKKTYIWNHDIINPLHYTEERLEKIEKVMVLSPWHRGNIPEVADEKIMVTGNGITI